MAENALVAKSASLWPGSLCWRSSEILVRSLLARELLAEAVALMRFPLPLLRERPVSLGLLPTEGSGAKAGASSELLMSRLCRLCNAAKDQLQKQQEDPDACTLLHSFCLISISTNFAPRALRDGRPHYITEAAIE